MCKIAWVRWCGPGLCPNFAPQFVLNQRVKEGQIKPVFDTGDRRYSGFVITGLLGWPLGDGPRNTFPGRPRLPPGRVRPGAIGSRSPCWILNSAAGRCGCSLVSRVSLDGHTPK